MEKKWQKEKLVNPENVVDHIRAVRQKGQTVASLNGSFDLLHAGHLEILFEASQTADHLIVCLNTDASIQKYKSRVRPIIPLKYRLQMMAAIRFVDAVTWFDETDPIRILSEIKPDVHVNGSEYGEDCIEAETVKKNGGKIHVVSLVEGLSTSNILEKIRSCAS